MAAERYVNTTDHALPLASGRVLARGEDAPVDVKSKDADPQDQALVDDGSLLKTEEKKA
jgi:hypothetical protein